MASQPPRAEAPPEDARPPREAPPAVLRGGGEGATPAATAPEAAEGPAASGPGDAKPPPEDAPAQDDAAPAPEGEEPGPAKPPASEAADTPGEPKEEEGGDAKPTAESAEAPKDGQVESAPASPAAPAKFRPKRPRRRASADQSPGSAPSAAESEAGRSPGSQKAKDSPLIAPAAYHARFCLPRRKRTAGKRSPGHETMPPGAPVGRLPSAGSRRSRDGGDSLTGGRFPRAPFHDTVALEEQMIENNKRRLLMDAAGMGALPGSQGEFAPRREERADGKPESFARRRRSSLLGNMSLGSFGISPAPFKDVLSRDAFFGMGVSPLDAHRANLRDMMLHRMAKFSPENGADVLPAEMRERTMGQEWRGRMNQSMPGMTPLGGERELLSDQMMTNPEFREGYLRMTAGGMLPPLTASDDRRDAALGKRKHRSNDDELFSSKSPTPKKSFLQRSQVMEGEMRRRTEAARRGFEAEAGRVPSLPPPAAPSGGSPPASSKKAAKKRSKKKAPPDPDAAAALAAALPDKPKRPFSAYNLFFQLEREFIIQEVREGRKPMEESVIADALERVAEGRTEEKDEAAKEQAVEAKEAEDSKGEDPAAPQSDPDDPHFRDPTIPARYRHLQLDKHWHSVGHKRKRKHRKTEGSVGFVELTKMVSSRWKCVESTDPHVRRYCQKLADVELRVYKRAMEEYKRKAREVEREAKAQALMAASKEAERAAGGEEIGALPSPAAKKEKGKRKRKSKKGKAKEGAPAIKTEESFTPLASKREYGNMLLGGMSDLARMSDFALSDFARPSALHSHRGEFLVGMCGDAPSSSGGTGGLPPPPFAEGGADEARGSGGGDVERRLAALAEAEARHKMQMEATGGRRGRTGDGPGGFGRSPHYQKQMLEKFGGAMPQAPSGGASEEAFDMEVERFLSHLGRQMKDNHRRTLGAGSSGGGMGGAAGRFPGGFGAEGMGMAMPTRAEMMAEMMMMRERGVGGAGGHFGHPGRGTGGGGDDDPALPEYGCLGRPSPSTLSLPHARASIIPTIGDLRGGGGDSSGGRKQKRKGKASKKSAASDAQAEGEDDGGDAKGDTDGKGAINNAMKETDAATALGDAIRARADILRADRLPYPERTFDTALVSLGLSMGTAGTDKDTEEGERGEGKENVEALAYYQYGQKSPRRVKVSTAALLGNYFLKSHGGTHMVQFLLSLLASVMGVACLLLPSFPSAASLSVTAGDRTAAKAMDAQSLSRKILLSTMKCQLMQQTLLLAMAKHASGLLGAAFLGASRIPQLGVRNARRYIEPVAQSPVGQYLFYCSLLVVWMGWFGGGAAGGMRDYVRRLMGTVVSIMNASAAAASSSDATGGSAADADATAQLLNVLSQTPPPWFLSQSSGGSLISVLILGPILMREVISVLWVVSDVLTLAFNSSDGVAGKALAKMLSGGRHILDAFMSVLVSSEKWRKADSCQRQRTLAKLVAKCSLLLELAVGGVLVGDAVLSLWGFALGGPTIAAGDAASASAGRLPFKCVLGKMACAHLYVIFLLSRRKKLRQ
ncbi:hypothetical protein ACHAXT_002095 [Thalassiosira profunda]